MINFTELFTCDKTELHEKLQNDKKYIDTIKLSVLVNQEGDLLFIMGNICYGITKETKAKFYLYENNNGSYMILDLDNSLHGSYQLLVKENCDLLVACLSERCTVVGKEKDIKKQQVITLNGNVDPKKQDGEVDVDVQVGLPLAQDDGSYVRMSKYLGQGIYTFGKFLSKRIQSVGNYVASNVEPSKEIKFSENTKQNLRKINEFSGKVLDLSSGAMKKLINYGKQVACEAANQSESVRKLQEQKFVNGLKNGAMKGMKVFINLYDGMVEAGDQVTKGTFKAGRQIFKKKYGLEAEQALHHVAGGVNNVVKVYKLPKESVKYLFEVDKEQKN